MEIWVTQTSTDPDSAIKIDASPTWYVSDVVKECSKLFIFDDDVVPPGGLSLTFSPGTVLPNRTKLTDLSDLTEVFTVSRRGSGIPPPPSPRDTFKRRRSTFGEHPRTPEDWSTLLTDFYYRHSYTTLCTVPYVLSKYEGEEMRLWQALLLRHGVTEATYDTRPRTDTLHVALASVLSVLVSLSPCCPSSPLQASPSSGGITCSDSFEARRLLSEVSNRTANTATRRLPAPGHQSMGSIDSTVHALNDTKISMLNVDSEGDDDEKCGYENDEQNKDLLDSMHILLQNTSQTAPQDPEDSLNRTSEIRRKLSEVANSDARSTESCKKLLESVGTKPISSETDTPEKACLDQSRSLGDVGESGEEGDEEDDAPLNNKEEAKDFDDIDTDSDSEMEEGRSTMDMKRHYHRFLDFDVKGINDCRGMLQGIQCVAMSAAHQGFEKLSPRIDLGPRPLTPREKIEAMAKREKRKSITLKSVNGEEEYEDGKAIVTRRKLSSLAASDVKSAASMRRLLDSVGALAMNDEDGMQLTPRLHEDTPKGPRETPRGFARRKDSTPAEESTEKKPKKDSHNITIDNGQVFNIEVISCSTKSEVSVDRDDEEEEEDVRQPEIDVVGLDRLSTPSREEVKEETESLSSTEEGKKEQEINEARCILEIDLASLRDESADSDKYDADRLEPQVTTSNRSSRASTPKIPPLNLGGISVSPVSPMLKAPTSKPASVERNLPTIIEPVPDPVETEKKKLKKANDIRMLLQGVGMTQGKKEEEKDEPVQEEEPVKDEEEEDDDDETPNEGPSEEEIKKVIPAAILAAIGREGQLGTIRCSIRSRRPVSPKEIAASTLKLRGTNPFGLGSNSTPEEAMPSITMQDVLNNATTHKKSKT